MKEYSVKDMSAAIEREIRKNDGIISVMHGGRSSGSFWKRRAVMRSW